MSSLLRGILRYVIRHLIWVELRAWNRSYKAHSERHRHAETPQPTDTIKHPYIYHDPSQGLPDVRVRPYDPREDGGQTNWN